MGVETAFVTVPGHIFLAARLNLSEGNARALFLRPDDLIYEDGEVWLPIEATLLGSAFLESWAVAARQYREDGATGDAPLWPLRNAWAIYEPVAAFDVDSYLPEPEEGRVQPIAATTWRRFVTREIASREEMLLDRISNSTGIRAIRDRNSLGVLYARYGLMDQAAEQFGQILRTTEYGPALSNLGNIAYLEGDFELARDSYERARDVSPDDALTHVQLARVYSELGYFDESRQAFDRAAELDAETAEQYGFLGSDASARGRESSAQQRGIVPWSE